MKNIKKNSGLIISVQNFKFDFKGISPFFPKTNACLAMYVPRYIFQTVFVNLTTYFYFSLKFLRNHTAPRIGKGAHFGGMIPRVLKLQKNRKKQRLLLNPLPK